MNGKMCEEKQVREIEKIKRNRLTKKRNKKREKRERKNENEKDREKEVQGEKIGTPVDSRDYPVWYLVIIALLKKKNG